MKPTIGRTVWYQAHGSPDGTHKSEPRPAIITRVCNPNSGSLDVDLCVISPTGLFFNQGCMYSEEGTGGTWRWPEIVKV